jgi:hypothetical protein
LAEPDTTPAHLENAVPRWWRSEVLGTTVVGDGAEGMTSLDGEEGKKGRGKQSKKGKRGKPTSPTSPTLSTTSENQRGLTKEEIAKIQAKAMKVRPHLARLVTCLSSDFQTATVGLHP